MAHKCVFLDRDGVLNRERGEYTFLPQDFEVIKGVPTAIDELKKNGFLVIIITNQAGIAKGIYTREQMKQCHELLQEACHHAIDAIYYCPYHPTYSASLARKPDSLMFEKAMARFDIKPETSWMAGDKERDLIPARKLGIKTIGITESQAIGEADFMAKNLTEAVAIILEQHKKAPNK